MSFDILYDDRNIMADPGSPKSRPQPRNVSMSQYAKGPALITGASTGIGAVYARRLAARGYNLVLVARDAARLQALTSGLQEIGAQAEILSADLTRREDRAKVERRLEADATITLLVNNAGMSVNGTLASND